MLCLKGTSWLCAVHCCNFFSFDREYAWLPHASVFKIHNFSLTKRHFPRPNNHKMSDKVKAFPFLPPRTPPVPNTDMEASTVKFCKKRAVWCLHWTVLTCHLQAWILVVRPSLVKWGVMSGRYLYMDSRSSLTWIYKVKYDYRTHTMTHRGSMQWFLRNLRNGIIHLYACTLVL